ncbi:MAG: hypothetical protein ACXACX_20130 [Candidatus Hodarchaeales archaeon]
MIIGNNLDGIDTIWEDEPSDESVYLRFKDGRLYVPSKRDKKILSKKDILSFGLDKRDERNDKSFAYLIRLDAIKEAIDGLGGYRWKSIGTYCKVRKTITGSLKIKKLHEKRKGIQTKSKFSRNEFEKIKDIFRST